MAQKLFDNFELSFFFSRGGNSPYTCIYTESIDYSVNTPYLAYDIPELLRLIIIKKELMDDELVNYYYRNSNNSICLILEWNELVRKVVRFSTKTELDIHQFKEFVTQNKEEIAKHFKKSFFKFQDQYETV